MVSSCTNIGILASIVFLATQIKQNSQMMEVQALTTNTATHVQTDLAGLGDNPVRAFTKYFAGSVDLTDDDLTIILGWLSANSWQFRNSFKLYELGIISEEAWQAELGIIAGYFGTPVGLAYWNATKGFYRPRYIQAVESALSEGQRAGTTWRERIREGIRAAAAANE